MIEQHARSRTMWFALTLAVLGVVQASMEVFTPYLTPQGVGFVTLIIGAVVAILRVLTTQAISDK